MNAAVVGILVLALVNVLKSKDYYNNLPPIMKIFSILVDGRMQLS